MGRWYGSAPKAALSTAWTAFSIAKESSVAGSTDLPASCDLVQLVVLLDTIAGGATTVNVAISHDAAGNSGVTPFTTSQSTQTISAPGGGADGYVSFAIGVPWISETGEVPTVRVRLDAGTANGQPKLYASTGD